jgi:hypothetical protein
MDAYRDPLAALRSQIATKRVVIAEVERALGPLALAALPEEEAGELAALREGTSDEAMSPETETVESLCEIERRQDALQALLHGIAERWKLPGEPSLDEAPPQPWAEGPRGMADVRAALESTFGEGTVERFGAEAFRVRFLDEDALLVLVADVFPTERRGFVEIGHLALTLRGSMPEALPAFALGPEVDVGAYQNRIRSPHWLSGEIHKRPKRQLPPERAFWISGHEAAAAALVDDEVHHDLLDLLSTCVLEAPSARVFPSLRAGPGFVEVGYTRAWESDSTELLADEALRIVHALRRRVSRSSRA